jgi:hypothetical protein
VSVVFTPTAIGARFGTVTVLVGASTTTTLSASLFGVGKGLQAITFTSTPPASARVGDPAYTVTATGGASGNPVTFSIDASSTPGACSIAGASVSLLGVGTCVVAADQAGNTNYMAATKATQSFAIASADMPRLANISTRMQVLTGDNVLIGGFIIGGSAPKTVVVRARGPSLAAQGVPGVLANPNLQLFSGATPIAQNNDWSQASNATAIQSSGFAPSDGNESAIMTTLNPGAYTAIVTGVAGGTGVAIIEVFEVDAPTVPLINISTRGLVQTGDNVMIGGFIIQGSGPQTVVVRARGPSLAAQGVSGVLANPNLQLFSGATPIAQNNDWGQASNAAAIQASGFAPSDSSESAIMLSLNPGAYTAIVTGVAGGTGVAIIEVFTTSASP